MDPWLAFFIGLLLGAAIVSSENQTKPKGKNRKIKGKTLKELWREQKNKKALKIALIILVISLFLLLILSLI